MSRPERYDHTPKERRDEEVADSASTVPAASLEMYERALIRILWTLRVYLPDIVVIGGWVPHLYMRYGGFATWNGRLSLTAEVDVLVSSTTGTDSRPPITELLAAEGFKPGGGSIPAAVWTNAPERGERVEFLVAHEGTRAGIGSATELPRQPKLSAISLPELEIMGEFTRGLEVPIAADGRNVTIRIRVPVLGAYMVNKAITYRNPHPGDLCFHAIRPRRFEVHPADRRQDVDPIWWHAELRHDIRSGEIVDHSSSGPP